MQSISALATARRAARQRKAARREAFQCIAIVGAFMAALPFAVLVIDAMASGMGGVSIVAAIVRTFG